MEELDNRYIKITLDDAIIKATNETGEEKLRLAVKVSGKEVHVGFPSYANWDFYYQDMAKLLMIIANTAGEIELEFEKLPEQTFQKWAYVMSEVVRFKHCKDIIDKIFFNYLDVKVEGFEGDVREWLGKNLKINHVFYMFTSILQLEYWLKKKAMEFLQMTIPNLTQQYSKDTSPRSSTQPPKSLPPGQAFDFV